MRRVVLAIMMLMLFAGAAGPVRAAEKPAPIKQELRANLMLAAM